MARSRQLISKNVISPNPKRQRQAELDLPPKDYAILLPFQRHGSQSLIVPSTKASSFVAPISCLHEPRVFVGAVGHGRTCTDEIKTLAGRKTPARVLAGLLGSIGAGVRPAQLIRARVIGSAHVTRYPSIIEVRRDPSSPRRLGTSPRNARGLASAAICGLRVD